MTVSVVKIAVEKVGSISKLARACGVSPQAVSKWVEKGKIPVERCKAVEEVTGIDRSILRPDIYVR